MAVSAALLITFVTSLEITKICASPYPLDMALDAVDDMYDGCIKEMDEKVKKEYLEKEKNQDKDFKEAWGEAQTRFQTKWWQHFCPSCLKAPPSPLTEEQMMAIYVYSLDSPKVYYDFNAAVRAEKSKYRTTFKYHTLHFYLTVALQTLKGEQPGCQTSYRRTKANFKTDVLNKEMRFSSFSSSSTDWDANREFGEKSCFEIETCSGADISSYSEFPGEREVLIPPYEVFKVTNIKYKSDVKDLPCEVVYILKSTKKPHSNLNCALVK